MGESAILKEEVSLRLRFEAVIFHAEEILRAAKQMGVPDDKANVIAIGILSRQAAMAEAAFRLPQNEDKWNRYEEYMKKLEAEP